MMNSAKVIQEHIQDQYELLQQFSANIADEVRTLRDRKAKQLYKVYRENGEAGDKAAFIERIDELRLRKFTNVHYVTLNGDHRTAMVISANLNAINTVLYVLEQLIPDTSEANRILSQHKNKQ